MKFATAKEHRDFFQKQGWIEFEGLLTNEQIALIDQSIDEVLAERLKAPSDGLRFLSSEKFYLQGRDLWRSNPILHKFVMQTRFAEIAAELIEKKPLRLGYDQFFPPCSRTLFAQETPQIYARFLEQTAPLQAISCLHEVVCGLLLSLGGKEDLSKEEASSQGIDIFPSRPGHVIFFQPNVPVNWSRLYEHPGQRFYMIVYTQASAYYHLQPQDPHTHALKRLGYVFNDKLSDKLNPIIYR